MVSTPLAPTDSSVEAPQSEGARLVRTLTPYPGKSDPADEGSSGNGGLAVLAFAVAVMISALAFWQKDTVLMFVARTSEYLRGLPTEHTAAAFFFAIVAENISPVPLLSITLCASGFALGFPLGFYVVYPAALIGSVVCFVLTRSCCLMSASRVIAGRQELAAFAEAIKSGGLKLVILLRIAPTPTFWASVLFATCEVTFRDFLVAYALVDLKYIAYVYMGSAAGDIMTALGRGDLADGGSESSGSSDGVSENVKQMQLVMTVLGIFCGMVSIVVVGVYTKRELARIKQLQGSTIVPSGEEEDEDALRARTLFGHSSAEEASILAELAELDGGGGGGGGGGDGGDGSVQAP